MKVSEVRLFKSPEQSFIFLHETDFFTPWHHHPEYELVMMKKGKGIRFVGDHIERFQEDDLVFLGSYLPHEWRCDKSFYTPSGEFLGECIVIQFLKDSFGHGFFDLPENKGIKHNTDGNGNQDCRYPALHKQNSAEQPCKSKESCRLGNFHPDNGLVVPAFFHQIHCADAKSQGKSSVSDKAGNHMCNQPVAL